MWNSGSLEVGCCVDTGLEEEGNESTAWLTWFYTMCTFYKSVGRKQSWDIMNFQRME